MISTRGVVRLTNHDLADHDRSGLSRCKLTPLGQSGGTVLFEDMAAVEVMVEVKVVVDRGVRGGKFLQGFDVPEPVSYTHLRAHETDSYLVCRLLLEKKKNTTNQQT